jgi:hypothetical protein
LELSEENRTIEKRVRDEVMQEVKQDKVRVWEETRALVAGFKIIFRKMLKFASMRGNWVWLIFLAGCFQYSKKNHLNAVT